MSAQARTNSNSRVDRTLLGVSVVQKKTTDEHNENPNQIKVGKKSKLNEI